MNTYNLNFLHWRLNVSPLKEKEINRVKYILSQSRHCRNISFRGYAECVFGEGDEETHWKPIVTELESFNRRRANMAIFDVHVYDGNDRFDKLFLYYSNNVRISNWGYVLLNTKTGEQKHKYCIYDDMFDLIIHINRELNKIQWHDDGKFHDEPEKGVVKNVYTKYDGLLALNDRTRVDMPELPQVAVSKEFYRNNKSFIAV